MIEGHVHLWDDPSTVWKMEILPEVWYLVNCQCGAQVHVKGRKLMQEHDVGCLVNHDGPCPGYPHSNDVTGESVRVERNRREAVERIIDRNKKMKKYPYVSAKDITLTEEVETTVSEDPYEVKTVTKYWIARLDGSAYDHDGYFVSANGPRVEMRRTGNTAEEAHRSLVEALEEQGWTVR